MKNLMNKLLGLVLASVVFSVAWADSPPSLAVPDSHSIPAVGVVDLYRVQLQGLEFGREKEEIDAEVLVTLDSNPGMVYTLRLHEDSPPVNTMIADTLKDAYMNKTPVTIYHQIAPGRKNVKIHMVQLN